MSGTIGTLLIGRLVAALATLWFVATMVFVITNLLPGDVAQELLGQSATPEAVAGLRKALGLDVPPIERYLAWLGGLIRGDFGRSLVNQMPVAQLIGSRLGNSLLLAGITALVAVPLALALGIAAAVKRGSIYDRAIGVGTVLAVSVPEFLVASAAVLVFAVHLRWLPALSQLGRIETFFDAFRVFVLPVLTLTFVIMAQMARMTRAALVDVLSSSYIEMARLKGASPARIVVWHALPNAIGPIANAIAFSLSFLLGGVIIVETVFNYPGIAKLMVDGVSTRDIPLVQACAMLFCGSLPAARDRGGHRGHPRQPAPEAPMSAGKAVASPLRTRVSASLRFIMPGIVLFWLAMTFIGHWVAPYGGAAMQDADLFEGMSRKFLLGTDYLGRDMLSRILEGARFTVGISLAATALAVGVGLLLALTRFGSRRHRGPGAQPLP